jgi:hypothetical protein
MFKSGILPLDSRIPSKLINKPAPEATHNIPVV